MSWPQAVGLALTKIYNPGAASALLGPDAHFRAILDAESRLHLWARGSLLSEVFSYRSRLITLLYPFLAIGYLELVNYLRRNAGLFGLFVFVFYAMLTVFIFRGGVVFMALEPFYYAWLALSWYWVMRLVIATGPEWRITIPKAGL